MTIHNLGYQGIYGKHKFHVTGLDWNVFYSAGFEDYDSMNFLKAGLVSADFLTTVSPTYAKEIQNPAFGFRMDGILRYRSENLVGILNGVDTNVWNPAIDKKIVTNYTAKSISKKIALFVCSIIVSFSAVGCSKEENYTLPTHYYNLNSKYIAYTYNDSVYNRETKHFLAKFDYDKKIFIDKNGKRFISLHSPNTPPNERMKFIPFDELL